MVDAGCAHREILDILQEDINVLSSKQLKAGPKQDVDEGVFHPWASSWAIPATAPLTLRICCISS